jgi:hypothetical protein
VASLSATVGPSYGRQGDGEDPEFSDEDTVESPDVMEESATSIAIDPLAVASPVFARSVVLSPTETIAPLVAITMSLPLATTENPGPLSAPPTKLGSGPTAGEEAQVPKPVGTFELVADEFPLAKALDPQLVGSPSPGEWPAGGGG